jgi:chromosome segregation ATPase
VSKFFKFGEAQAQIAALNEQLTAANLAVTTSTAAASKAVTDIAALVTERDRFKAQVETVNTTLSALTVERDTLKTEVVTLKAAAKTADELSVEHLAAVGVRTPIQAEAQSDSKTLEVLWAEYRTLATPSAQRAFYVKSIAPLLKS